MATSDEIWQQRSRSFGAIAREYDRVRPSYPPAMIDDLVGLLPGHDVAEIGAGTGKATVLFAAHGLRMTSVEPDPGMAAVLRDRVSELPVSDQPVSGPPVDGLPNVRIVVSSFEDWQPDQQFDALVAAQSWHWTDPKSRYLKAAAVLRTGGLLAPFWNVVDWARTPINKEIDDVYRHHDMLESSTRSQRGAADPEPWVRDEISPLPIFTDVEIRSYPWELTYSSAEWADHVGSTSNHLILPPDRRDALLTDLRRVIDTNGGTIAIYYRCDLYLAWRTDVPA